MRVVLFRRVVAAGVHPELHAPARGSARGLWSAARSDNRTGCGGGARLQRPQLPAVHCGREDAQLAGSLRRACRHSAGQFAARVAVPGGAGGGDVQLAGWFPKKLLYISGSWLLQKRTFPVRQMLQLDVQVHRQHALLLTSIYSSVSQVNACNELMIEEMSRGCRRGCIA